MTAGQRSGSLARAANPAGWLVLYPGRELAGVRLPPRPGKHRPVLFPIKRFRGYQIITNAAKKAGLEKRVYPHLLRHSDAIERLRQTRNPNALQDHLGHASPLMTLRYLSTLQEEDSLRIQQDVEFD